MNNQQPTANTKTRNKLVLIGLFAAFLVPFLWAFYLYKNPESSWLSAGQSGQLIVPAQPIAGLTNQQYGDRKWTLLLMTTGACEQECQGLLHAVHRLVRSMGTEQQRLQRWLISPAPLAAGKEFIQLSRFTPDAETIRRYINDLPKAEGKVVVNDYSTAIYFIDPLGRVLIVYPRDVELKKVRKDLRRLLRASRIG